MEWFCEKTETVLQVLLSIFFLNHKQTFFVTPFITITLLCNAYWLICLLVQASLSGLPVGGHGWGTSSDAGPGILPSGLNGQPGLIQNV